MYEEWTAWLIGKNTFANATDLALSRLVPMMVLKCFKNGHHVVRCLHDRDEAHHCIARSGKLDRARSRLYRGQILQENMRLKALAEIYTMHSFAQLCNLIFCQNFKFGQKFAKYRKKFQLNLQILQILPKNEITELCKGVSSISFHRGIRLECIV